MPMDRLSPTKRFCLLVLCSTLLSALLCLSMEMQRRQQGYRPSVRDDLDLWALERQRANAAGAKAVAILGTSRILYGLDLAEFQRLLPKQTPVMLAVNGAYPLASFADLASDPSFQGDVLIEVDARGLARYYRDAQAPQVQHFRLGVGPSAQLHRRMLSQWQNLAVIADPNLGWLAATQRRFFAAPAPFPQHARMFPDRSASLDFSHPGISTQGMAAHFAAGVHADYLEHPPQPPAQWLAELADLKAQIHALRARGGHVWFFCAPTGGAHWQADQAGYPRHAYWDVFAEQIARAAGASAIYAHDVPALHAIALPDGSHIDQHDRRRFTQALVAALREGQ